MIWPRLLVPTAAALAVLAAGCGGNGGHHRAAPQTTTTAAKGTASCKLNGAQRRAIARSLADIRLLRRIQAPLHKFSDRGTPAQETVTGKLLLDVGSVKLPVDIRANLLHRAKAAVGLCGLCFQGIEAEEPVLATRLGEKRCG